MKLSHADTLAAVYCCSNGCRLALKREAQTAKREKASSGSMRGNGTDDIESNRRKSSSPTSTLDWLAGVIYCSRNTQVTWAERKLFRLSSLLVKLPGFGCKKSIKINYLTWRQRKKESEMERRCQSEGGEEKWNFTSHWGTNEWMVSLVLWVMNRVSSRSKRHD